MNRLLALALFDSPLALALVLLVATGFGCTPPDASREANRGASAASARGAGDDPSGAISGRSFIEGDFETPESVLHDPAADVYLVSNIHGSPLGEDGKPGFISRVLPSGEVEALRWIDGASEGVELRAPKGLAITADALWVADVTVVRKFDRRSGAPRGAVAVEGATFLNDLAAGPGGVVYVSDTGLRPGSEGPGTDAVYEIRPGSGAGEVRRLARGAELAHPNGLLALDGGVLVASWSAPKISRIGSGGRLEAFAATSGGQLDGLVRDAAGRFYATSWERKAVLAISPDGKSCEALVGDLDAPADLGIDAKRRRLLVPLFRENRILVIALPAAAE